VLSLFRRNLFVNYIWLFLFTAGCLAYYFINLDALSINPFNLNLSDQHSISIPFNDKPFIQIIYGFILIYLQALMIANIVIKNRMSRLLSIIPGAIMVLYSVWLLHSGAVHTILLANFFFIVSVQNLFNLYKKHNPIGIIFNSGFFLGVASLIYFPYYIFFPAFFLGLLSLRGIKIQEFLQLLVAFLCPFFLAGVFMFYNKELQSMSDFYTFEFHMVNIDLNDILTLVKLIIISLICILMVFLNPQLLKKKKYDVIKKIELNYWFLLFGFLSLFLINDFSNNHMMIVSAPFAILAGLFMESRQSAITKEFVFFLFVAFYFSMVFEVI